MKHRLPILFLYWLLISIVAMLAQSQPAGPKQPIAFSHQQHAGTLKLKCNMCHANRDPGETMGIAPVATCMQCHSTIKADSPEIQKLAEYAKADRRVRWVRVYEIPTYVAFSHRVHLQSGNTCQDCHGPVQQREVLAREGDISMSGCMNCHKAKNASNDCTFCHEQRN